MKKLRKNRHLRKICGLLFLDKPSGYSSQQVVFRVKRAFRAEKAGHTGSLDPLATGMLPICFGDATKYADYLLSATKVYEVTAKLGTFTNTGDINGEILEEQAVTEAMLDSVDEVIQSFTGNILQTPPMFSAIKFQGKPLYHFARKGEEIERAAREVTLSNIERLPSEKREEISLRVTCSKGTYIRTLVEDIGKKLGCGACVTRLRRLQVGPYAPEQMISLDEIEQLEQNRDFEQLNSLLKPITLLVDSLPVAIVQREVVDKVRIGMVVEAKFSETQTTEERFQILTEEGEFLGVGIKNEKGLLAPKRLLAVS